jgi:tRNA pseudouridine55 synthase
MTMRPSYNGLLVLDKPGRLTSREAVDRALRWFPRGTRAGHTGTLDPLATGVLVLCLGTATRLTEYVQRMDKVYRAVVRLGARSDTDDADGQITMVSLDQPPSAEVVTQALGQFVGELEQVPPAYSAAKLTGQRAYELARRGHEVALEPRRVRIDQIDVLAYDFPRLEIEVRCGKGTYIRSLARDLGNQLGCGGLIETLRRTRVGPFLVENGVTLEVDASAARSHLLPLGAAVSELPRVTLSRAAVQRLRHGLRVPLSGATMAGDAADPAREWAVFDEEGKLAAIAQFDRQERVLKPSKVFSDHALSEPGA